MRPRRPPRPAARSTWCASGVGVCRAYAGGHAGVRPVHVRILHVRILHVRILHVRTLHMRTRSSGPHAPRVSPDPSTTPMMSPGALCCHRSAERSCSTPSMSFACITAGQGAAIATPDVLFTVLSVSTWLALPQTNLSTGCNKCLSSASLAQIDTAFIKVAHHPCLGYQCVCRVYVGNELLMIECVSDEVLRLWMIGQLGIAVFAGQQDDRVVQHGWAAVDFLVDGYCIAVI